MSPPLSSEQAIRVERHTALVARLARSIAKGGISVLSVEELESVGNEALVRCALRYDPNSEASFSTFAHYRVRGAMIDAVRAANPTPRRIRRAARALALGQCVAEEAQALADDLAGHARVRPF